MKIKSRKFEIIPLAKLDEVKKKEALRISFKRKMEITTMLREVFYGKKATTGRVQRIHSVAKLGED